MEVVTNVNPAPTPTCCSKMTACLCTAKTANVALNVFLVAFFLASPAIPAPSPVQGMIWGGCVMLLTYRASLAEGSICTVRQWPPRTWKQVTAGTVIGAGSGAAAMSVTIYWIIPICLGGMGLGVWVMFDDRLWWLYEQLKNRICHITPDQYQAMPVELPAPV